MKIMASFTQQIKKRTMRPNATIPESDTSSEKAGTSTAAPDIGNDDGDNTNHISNAKNDATAITATMKPQQKHIVNDIGDDTNTTTNIIDNHTDNIQ